MCTVNLVCKDDLLLVVGDFNARVGSNHPEFVKGVVLGVTTELVMLMGLVGHF